MITGDEFFESPRDWSLLKYKILSCYFSQYFPKVNNKFKMAAVVADLFAGRGKFQNGREGSPLILAQQARIYNERLGLKNKVILAEKIEADRQQLCENLQEYIDSNVVDVIPGDAADAGNLLMASIKPGIPLFIFFYPFGIKGLSIELLQKILQRAKRDSTELLLNFNHRALPRLAGICKHLNSDDNKLRKQAVSAKQTADEVFGGDWWLETMSDPALADEEKALHVLDTYSGSYQAAFKWFVKIPVPESFLHGGKPKYFLVFGSQSIVALELMNDCVNRAQKELILAEIARQNQHTLFDASDPEQFIPNDFRVSFKTLTDRMLLEIRRYCTEHTTNLNNLDSVVMNRQAIRGRLVPDLFARYSTSEYNESIAWLLKNGKLTAENGRTRISDYVGFRLKEPS